MLEDKRTTSEGSAQRESAQTEIKNKHAYLKLALHHVNCFENKIYVTGLLVHNKGTGHEKIIAPC